MRRYLIILTLGWMIPMAIYVSVNWLIDPYRIFHKPWVRENYYAYDATMRDGAAGIINTEEFDSVILGSSMAANFSATEASQIFGGRFVNISLDGSGLTERSLVLKYAISKKNLTAVIFSLDFSQRERVEETPIAPYAYLYDDIRANDLLIYTSSPKALRYAFCRNFFIQSDLLCQNKTNDLETLVEWHSNWEHSRRFGGLNKWLESKNDGQIKDALKSVAVSIHTIESGKVKSVDREGVKRATSRNRRVFEDAIVKIVAEHQKTQFYLFFPPYSRLQYAIRKQSDPQSFEEYLETLRIVVNESAQYPNVKVFGFDTESFLDDIANYKDTSHYHQRYNSEILRWMGKRQHQLTASNLDAYINEISERAKNYPLKEIGTQIDAYLMHSTHSR